MATTIIYHYDQDGAYMGFGSPDYGYKGEVLMPANSTTTSPNGINTTWNEQYYEEGIKAWVKKYTHKGMMYHKEGVLDPIVVDVISSTAKGLEDKLAVKYPEFTRSSVSPDNKLKDYMTYQSSTDTFEPDSDKILKALRTKIKVDHYEEEGKGLKITSAGSLRGKVMDCGESTVIKIDAAHRLAEIVGNKEMTIRDYNNNNHTVPVSQVKTVVTELGKHAQNRLIILWGKLDSLEGKGIDELASMLVR